MKQFKAQRIIRDYGPSDSATINHIITQHNKLCDYLEERLEEKEEMTPEAVLNWVANRPVVEKEWSDELLQAIGEVSLKMGSDKAEKLADLIKIHKFTSKKIMLSKPDWWKDGISHQGTYYEALEAASKASGILFKLED